MSTESQTKYGSPPTKSGYKRLFRLMREDLERVADPAPKQIRYLIKHRVDADRFALDLYDGVVMMDQFVEQGLMTQAQAELIRAIDRKFDEMSGEENAHLWDDEAIENGPEWQEVRRLAAAALAELDKP